jgi:HSP20 family protein
MYTQTLQDFEDDFLFPTSAIMTWPLTTTATNTAANPLGTLSSPALLRTDVRETDSAFEMKVDLPGVRKEDIAITVDDAAGTITVATTQSKEEETRSSGSAGKEGKEGKDGAWLVRERRYGRASRTQALPKSADLAKAAVELRDGTLHFSVPKREAPNTRTLSIA